MFHSQGSRYLRVKHMGGQVKILVSNVECIPISCYLGKPQRPPKQCKLLLLLLLDGKTVLLRSACTLVVGHKEIKLKLS